MLTALSIAVRIEPHLLRAARLALGLPAAVECALWRHPDVLAWTEAVEIKPTALADLHQRFLALPAAERRGWAQLVHRHHQGLSDLIRIEEADRARVLAGWQAPEAEQRWSTLARTQRLTAGNSAPALSEAIDRYARRAALRSTPLLWREVPGLAEAYVQADEAEIRAGAPLPDGLPGDAVARVLGRRSVLLSSRHWHLVVDGDALRLQPHHIQSFFVEAFQHLGGRIKRREEGRWEIAHVPVRIRERDRQIGNGAPLQTQYERICFEKDKINRQPVAAFVCPGHPLLEAVISLIREQYEQIMRQGAILVDDTDAGDALSAIFLLEHTVQDGRVTSAGKPHVLFYATKRVGGDVTVGGSQVVQGDVSRDEDCRKIAAAATCSSGTPTSCTAAARSHGPAPPVKVW